MAYAEVADVLGRAGRLSPTWDATSTPGLAEIERFLDDVAGEIDALIGAAGHTLPLTSATAMLALRGMNADGALILAIAGSFPGGSAPEAVSELLKTTQARYDAAMKGLADGSGAAAALLNAIDTTAPGANDFWRANPDYRSGISHEILVGLNPYLLPTIERGDVF